MKNFSILREDWLEADTQAYFSVEYRGFRHPNNPNYINVLKNDRHDYNENQIIYAKKKLAEVLKTDLPLIFDDIGLKSLIVCIVPRAKKEEYYSKTQLGFSETIKDVLKDFPKLKDGTEYIKRVENTKTTHLRDFVSRYSWEPEPYKGISKDTCEFSDKIKGKDILLIDDVYTKGVNIDEDMIEALFQSGAKSVTFYAIAYTVSRYRR